MISRRQFLASASAIALAPLFPHDEFLYRSGCVICFGERTHDLWTLKFFVEAVRTNADGAIMCRTLVPSALLKNRLQEQGLVTAWETDTPLPALIGSVAGEPHDVQARIERAVEGIDEERLWTDPMPEEWEGFGQDCGKGDLADYRKRCSRAGTRA